MAVNQRVRKIINWLVFIEYAENERDLAEKLGYTKSSFSQIVNGKVPLSNKFVKKLCSVDSNINEVWIKTGEGEMFLNSSKETQETTIPSDAQVTTIPIDAWEVIKAQAESLKNKDEQINGLISLLKQQKEDTKKTVALRGDNATSAAVG